MEEMKAAIKAELKQEADREKGSESEKDAGGGEVAASSFTDSAMGSLTTDPVVESMGPVFDSQVGEGPFTHRI